MGLTSLPGGLPIPRDDGAAAHLYGLALPEVVLPSTTGEAVLLSALVSLTVLFVYPMTGQPGHPLPMGWDSIPGARGCTPEACGFRDQFAEFRTKGAQIYGLSTQSPGDQQEAASRLGLPFPLLSDEQLRLAETPRLPTFEVSGLRLFKRLTMVVTGGRINRVFYPVFPPDRHAEEVLTWLRQSRTG
jgi:peroxiredoxin